MRLRNRGSSMFHPDQIFSTQLIDSFIEDVTNKKKTMVSTMDSVMMLMREVECEEKAAENAKEDADRCSLGILAKVEELKQAKKRAKERNDMLAREAYVQKDLLATKSDLLQLQAACLLDNGDRSLDLLDAMHKSLKKRLTSALMEKELTNKKKQENEASARAALSYEEIQMKKAGEEYTRLKQEALEISKLQEFLKDRGYVIDMLRGEIFNKCQDVKLLKDELDQVIWPDEIMSSSQTTSFIAFSSSSIIPCQPHNQIKSADSRRVFVAGINNSNGVEDITRSGKRVKIKGKLRGNRMFAKSIKKVKIKGKLYGSRLFAKRVKKVKVKGKLRGNRMFAKRVQKVKIKGKLHGSRMFAKSVKKAKIKGKQCVNRMFAKRTKNVKLKGKLHESRMFAKSIKKVKIKGQSPCKSNVCLKNQEVKIKSLRVVSERSAAADHRG